MSKNDTEQGKNAGTAEPGQGHSLVGRGSQGGGESPGHGHRRSPAPDTGYHRDTDTRGMGRGGGGSEGTTGRGPMGELGESAISASDPSDAAHESHSGCIAPQAQSSSDEGQNLEICCTECEWEMCGAEGEELARSLQTHMKSEHGETLYMDLCRERIRDLSHPDSEPTL